MDKFKITENSNLLIYDKRYSPEMIYNIITKENLNGLLVSILLESENLDNLNFLFECTFLKRLDLIIISKKKYDYNFLKKMVNLESLRLMLPFYEEEIDLSNLDKLQSVSLNFNQKIVGFNNFIKLKELNITDYKRNNLLFLQTLNTIEELTIISSNVKDLGFIEKFNKMKSLSIYDCKSLVDIDSISKLNRLQVLEFDSTTRVSNWQVIGNLNELRELILNDCKIIDNLKFVKGLGKLERLTFLGNTRILSKDLKPAIKIPEVIYCHINDYNIKLPNHSLEKTQKQNEKFLKKLGDS